MSRKCQISNKQWQNGSKVSHAHNKTNRLWQVNLHSKRLFDSTTGKWVRVKVSSRILRTIDKKGLQATLAENGLRIQDVLA